ncbi:hypothetical protein [Sphingomonas sp. Leaf62]|uniref:hypothetical protein n=1 Tax=Sphingomonas sp. Leaf62 TaxID=1736228 RepID=UPI0006FA2EC2|nr:hypothetical protein [Sphingomonas sp. Leaf62]KQN76233.1 hypothetical protein ASE91_16565 [Sphingomonas sp. Leaf62]
MRVLLPLLLLTAAATPAAAQIWDGGRSAVREAPPPPSATSLVASDLGDINRSIRDGRRRGDLTRAEARALMIQSAVIERLNRQYRQGGPIAMNAPALADRTLALRGEVAAARARPK